MERFYGKDIIIEPRCPFCNSLIHRPDSSMENEEYPIGRCECGAIYCCDITGHNLGSAMLELLSYRFRGEMDKIYDVEAGEDYEDSILKNYDPVTHKIIPAGVFQGRRIGGALYFLKFKSLDDEKGEALSPSPQEPLRSLSKREVEEFVRTFNIRPILKRAGIQKDILRKLKRLLYSGDELMLYRAADIIGRVCAIISQRDERSIISFLKGMISSVVDSAASSWGAIYTIGEIIRYEPHKFGPYIKYLYALLRDKELVSDIMMVIARISEVAPELFKEYAQNFIPLLRSSDPVIRGNTLIFLGNVGLKSAKDEIDRLLSDNTEIHVYREGQMVSFRISQLAIEALKHL